MQTDSIVCLLIKRAKSADDSGAESSVFRSVDSVGVGHNFYKQRSKTEKTIKTFESSKKKGRLAPEKDIKLRRKELRCPNTSTSSILDLTDFVKG